MDEMAAFTKMWVAFNEARPDVGLAWFIQHYQDGALVDTEEQVAYNHFRAAIHASECDDCKNTEERLERLCELYDLDGDGDLLWLIERELAESTLPEPRLTKETLDKIKSHVQTLRTVIEENGETYTPEGMVIFLRSLLADLDAILASPVESSEGETNE